MKFKQIEPQPDKKLVTEYELLKKWFERNRLKMKRLIELEEPKDSDKWKVLLEERALKMERYIELGKLIHNE